MVMRLRARAAWLVLTAASVGACIYDEDARCGPHMVVSEVDACECETGYVLVGKECITCPENEHVQGAGCVCDDGFARAVEGAACSELPTSGPGADCAANACMGSEFSECVEAPNGDQYCTSRGCTESSDCPEGFACRASAEGSYCQRTPVGMASPCEVEQDCAGYEATFCETLISHSCLVQGCSLSQNDCFEGWDCCDVTAYGMPIPICIPEGNCP
jgi:hypothetical protein